MKKTAIIMKASGGYQEVSIATAMKAIVANCLDCSCGERKEVRECPIKCCPLWPWRLGTHPFRGKRVLTEEQRAVAATRLDAVRKRGKQTG